MKLLAEWMISNGFATGHGDTTDDLLRELTWQVEELRRGHATAIRCREAAGHFDKVAAFIGGCTDGYCLVTGKAKGMHTNGGCKCFRRSDEHTVQRFMMAARKLRDGVEI